MAEKSAKLISIVSRALAHINIWRRQTAGALFRRGRWSFHRRDQIAPAGKWDGYLITVIPRLTSDPANYFSANEDFFRCFSDSANGYGFG